MNTIRRSPLARATTWMAAFALIAPILSAGRAAHAQTQQVIRVIVADIVNKSPGVSRALGINATAAMYNELVNSGQGRFFVLQNSEVLNEAKTLGLRVPTGPNQPANYSVPDLLRIAKSLNAEAILQGEVVASPVVHNRPSQVALNVTLREIASNEFINGGYAHAAASPRPGESSDPEELLNKAVEDASMDAVRQIVSRQLVVATVLNVTNNSEVILNRGVRDGIRVGDDVVILREGINGSKVKEGKVHIIRAYSTDSEATITENEGGMRPEDTGRVLYRPAVTLLANGGVATTSRGASFNVGAIGTTLLAIGLGVLVASAAKGGQNSVSQITAEANATSSAPTVRIRWSDSVFGQAGVLQYKIYREPDFPFGATSSSGNTNGGNNATGSIPIGVSTSLNHEYTDQGSPYFPYRSGLQPLVGNGNGAAAGGGGNNNNGGNTTSGCGSLTVTATTDTGFTPGNHYHYLVSAILQVQSQAGSGATQGNGGGGGNNHGSGYSCIETDPARSGQATPIIPVLLNSPSNNGTQDVRIFAPQFTSRNGADIFQIEVSTDRTFKNPALIYRTQVISSAPNADGVAQSLQNPIDLTQQPELLQNAQFKAFVAASQCPVPANAPAAPVPPAIYWRIGARSDGDSPGPVHWISQNPSDGDQTFRFVYSPPYQFTAAPLPPCPPGRAAALLNRLNTGTTRATSQLPKPVGAIRRASTNGVLTPGAILRGPGRLRP